MGAYIYHITATARLSPMAGRLVALSERADIVYHPKSGCAEGVNIELWVGEGSGHAPGYGGAFVDALLDRLLSQ